MKEIKCTILYCVIERTFVVPFYYGSGTVLGLIQDNPSCNQHLKPLHEPHEVCLASFLT
jgi:hypothetical protein